MKRNFFTLVLCLWVLSGCAQAALKDSFKECFLIGSSVNSAQVRGEEPKATDIVLKHYNTIVAENDMKSEVINPQKGVYHWDGADRFVDFGEKHGMFIIGHCLIWHSQLAKWFPYDDKGNYVNADTLKARMRTYIHDVVSRYKGRVHAWDVVNEAILDDGTYQPSPFYQIIGEEYIPLAFQYANEADPNAELYINDFAMESPRKRAKYIEIINNLKARGIRVDGIGHQCHMGIEYPNLDQLEQAIIDLSSTGVPVMLTEMDMGAIPAITHSADVNIYVDYDDSLNPYANGLPSDVDSLWNARMEQVMNICLRHSDKIKRICWWGVADGNSWKNEWPVPHRTDYPLPFDRQYRMKPFLVKTLQRLRNN